MWLIHRDTDGLSKDRIPVPGVVKEALVRWYIGEGTTHDERAGIALVQKARTGDRWVACDCRGADQHPAILTPAFLSEAETYYLRRLTSAKRPEHRPNCPFFRDQVINRITEVRSSTSATDPPSGFFEVLRPAPERLAQRPERDETDYRIRNASTPRLAGLLWRLMQTSGVHRIAPLRFEGARSIREEFAAISRAAAKLEVAPGMELARVIWTYARPLQANAVYAALRALEPSWPKGHATQGFVLLYARSFQGHEIHLADGENVHVANRVQSPSVRGNRISGPFLILTVIGQYPEARGFAPLRAYAQPIFNGRMFVPVDSDFERAVLRRLLECQHSLDRRGIDLAIDKPVFGTMTPEGPCRPDFVIEARSRLTGEIKTIVVEAMGFETEDYVASKAVTHPRMRRIGPLLTVYRKDVEADALSDKLVRLLDL